MKRIFLVEDNRHDQYFFTLAISEIANAILHGVANNGKEAIYKLNNSEILPDLIFSDINMPFMNGIDCLKEIVSNPHTQHIPVIMLSDSVQHAELAQQLGAKAFIEKPSNCELLREQLRKIINLDFAKDSPANNTFFP